MPIRYALVVLPPIVFSTANAAVFFAALEIAGTYGVMTLYGMLPAAMSWSERYSGGTSSSSSGSGSSGGAWTGLVERAVLVPGGRGVLLVKAAAALAVVVSHSLPE
jgi:tyrosine-specific transport protein